MALIEMTVEGIGIDPSNNPLVLLRDAERKVFVPIWIGPAEAVSINMALDCKETQRPMTHDLMANMLKDLGIKLVKITVNDFAESVYYASLHLQVGRNEENVHEVDARPSDAIALALRTRAQIWVSDTVAQKTGILVDENALPAADLEGLPSFDEEAVQAPPPEEINKFSRLLDGVDLGDESR